MADVYQHYHHGLHVLQASAHHADGFVFLVDAVVAVLLETDGAFDLLFDLLQEPFLLLLDEVDEGFWEDELALDLALGVVELGRFLLDGIGDGTLLLEHLIDDAAGLGDVGVVALYLGSAVDHAVDGLIDHDDGMGLLHYFVDLVSLGPDEEGDHALGDEDDD